jgi:hypothetical protein
LNANKDDEMMIQKQEIPLGLEILLEGWRKIITVFSTFKMYSFMNSTVKS